MTSIQFGAVHGPYTYKTMLTLTNNSEARAEKTSKQQQLIRKGQVVELFAVPTSQPRVADHYLLTGEDIQIGQQIKDLRRKARQIKPGPVEKKSLPAQVVEKIETLVSELQQLANMQEASLVSKAEK